MTTLTGYVMTLANSIIGVSLLAMPYCFKQCGMILAILLLFASNIVTRLACHLLVKSAVMCRRTSFELLGYHAFGRTGKLMIELGIIGFLLGTSIAFFVVIGELAPTIIARMFQLEKNDTLRAVVLLVSGLFIVLPLSLLRNIESLAAISTGTMLFYALFTVKLLAESFPHLTTADWTSAVNYWRPDGILQCFPIFAMALSCQTQMFEILEVLPGANLESMNGVVRSAVGLCTGFYVAVGFLGYVAYAREPISGNVLLSFSQSISSDLCQLGFVASIALSFPLVVFPCRASLHSLLSKRGPMYHDPTTQATYIADGRFKWLTLCIVVSSLSIGLLIPNIEFVLGFVGSTIGVATCVIFPASAFINISNKDTSERFLAKLILILGIFVMVFGTFVNIETAAGRQIVVPKEPLVRTSGGIVASVELPPIFEPPEDKNRHEASVQKKAVSAMPIGGNERREPPVPVEPYVKLEKADTQEKVPDVNAGKPVESKEPDRDKLPIEREEVLLKPQNDEELKHAQKSAELAPLNELGENNSKESAIKSSNLGDNIKPLGEGKKSETIHQDAIAREDKELVENDKQKEELDEKQKELLKKLKEHQEEQKKLLQEQQNILDQIKIRDELKEHQQEQKKLLEEQQNILNEIKMRDGELKPNSNVNVENINKMQGVIDDLKERKQVLDMTKGVKIAEDKKKVAAKKVNAEKTQILEEVDVVPKKTEFNSSAMSDNGLKQTLPLPLLKQGQAPVVPIERSKDTLEGDEIVLDRPKRDIDIHKGSCDKKEGTIIENNEVQLVTKYPGMQSTEKSSGIQISEILSPPDAQNLNIVKSESEVKTADNFANLISRREETRK